MSDQTYTVKGMTCDHCVRAVSDEVRRVPGITGVDVDLDSGRLAVRSDALHEDDIRGAVIEAGYEIVS